MSRTHLALINPPEDVQTTYAAFIQACQNWKPTEIPELSIDQIPLPHPSANTWPSVTDACGFIQHPDTMLVAVLWTFLFLFVIIIGFFYFTKLHYLPYYILKTIYHRYLQVKETR